MRLYQQLNQIEANFYDAVDKQLEGILPEDLGKNNRAELTAWLVEARKKFILFRESLGFDLLGKDISDVSFPKREWLAPRLQKFATELGQHFSSLVPNNFQDNITDVKGKFINSFSISTGFYFQGIKDIYLKCVPLPKVVGQITPVVPQTTKYAQMSDSSSAPVFSAPSQSIYVQESSSSSSSFSINIFTSNDPFDWYSSYGFNSGFNHRSHFRGFDGFVPGPYGRGYNNGVFARAMVDGGMALGKLAYNGAKQGVHGAVSLVKEVPHFASSAAGHVGDALKGGVHLVESGAEHVGDALKGGAHLVESGVGHLGDALKGGAHLVESGVGHLGDVIKGGAHLVVSGAEHLGDVGHFVVSGAGHAIGALGDAVRSADADCCKLFGGGVVVVGGAAGGAGASLIPEPPPATTPPAPPVQPNPPPTDPTQPTAHLHNGVHATHGQHAVHAAHPAAHAAKHATAAKISTMGATAGSSSSSGGGTTAVSITGLGLAKLIGGIVYAAILVPSIVRSVYQDVRNLMQNTKKDFSAKRFTARTVLFTAGFILGWFIPLGGPITAMTLAVFGAWVGQKATTWYLERQAKKSAHMLDLPEDSSLIHKFDEKTQGKLALEMEAGCSDPDTFKLSSEELQKFEEKHAPAATANSSTAQLIRLTNELYIISAAEEIASKKDQHLGWKIADKCYGVYKENANHATANNALKLFKKGEIQAGKDEVAKLGITVDENLTIMANNYIPSASIKMAAASA